jgi:uncharacterized membrane-anchored protein YhcB (DUF1043 family)
MNRITLISIVIGLIIGLTPQSKIVYSALTRKSLSIPEEYQIKLVANQNAIDKYRALAEAEYEKNKVLLDELLILNGIERKPDEQWTITLRNGKWQLYKK